MKKNYLLGMFAAASMLLATSCSNDELEAVQSGNEAQITFSVGAKSGIGSRAISDGKKADKLVWAVYNQAGDLLNVFKGDNDQYVGQETHTGVSDMTQTAKEVTVSLAKGQTYKVLFWAQDADCQVYTTTNLRNVEVNYENASNNDELRDAFFACKEIEVKGNETFKVDLKRPFAQINVGVTKADWDAAVASGVTVNQSAVTIKNAATEIDLFDGSVEGSTDVTYDLANIITDQDLEVDVNGNGTIEDDENFKYLSMSYILVDDKSTTDDDQDGTWGDARTTLESLSYTFTSAKGQPITFADGLTNVPVQRNWRTNIIGQILTGTVKFEVKIDNRFDGDNNISAWGGDQTVVTPTAEGVYEIKQATDLRWVANQISTLSNKDFKNQFDGKTIKLMADINLDGQAWTPINSWHAEGNTSVTLDGNGHKIIGMQVKAGAKAGFIGSNAADWTIKNLTFVDANVESTGNFAGVVFGYQYGYVVMENVDVQGGSVKSTANYGIRIGGLVGYSVVNDGATLSLTGCDVNGVTLQGYHNVGGLVGSVMTEGKATMTNCTSTNNIFRINNGTANYLKAWNAYDCNGYAEGKSIKTDCKALGNTVVGLSTAAEGLAAALTAIDENIHVILQNDIDLPIASLGDITAGSGEYKLGGENTKTITIDLNGHKLNITTTYWSAIGAKNDDALFTIKNGTMTSTGNSAGTWNAWDVRFSNCNYEFEEVTFEKEVALDNVGKSTTLKNVTINGTGDKYALWITAEGQNVTIDGLTIDNAGRGIKIDEQYVDAPSKVTLNINDATFKTAKKAAIVVKSVAGAEINASNLNLSGVAADNYHAVWVDADAAANADKVIVYGALKAVEGTVATVGNTEDLKAALAADGKSTILLSAGEYTFPTSSFKAGVTVICEEETVFEGNSKLNINGATVIGATFSNPSGNAVDQTINGTFKDCTFTGANGLRNCYAGETVVFENCVFNGGTYGVHFDGGANEAIFRNCTISGFNGLGAALTMVTFEGCTFVGNGRSGYNGANLWGSAKMIDCEFTFNGTTTNEWIDCIGADKTYEFTNCTVNGVKYTKDNYSQYTQISSRNEVTVKINGEDCKLSK